MSFRVNYINFWRHTRYEFLTHMMAYVCGLKLKYQPRQFLTVRFVGNIKTIHNFIYKSVILESYQPMLAIKVYGCMNLFHVALQLCHRNNY
uniref:Bm14177 n=1 Tax=Brugia malayi TaxID=6279 RepID=A0A1I9G1J9_BRUMA|nr:Bm14177 [Brugia malayi]